ncbi:MAG: fumarylacetoacetate hydrolase family protein [Chlamydiae bacterium]|nr:fumarylacetoacetate hydrolase family protein [Chlamydiota bacterium]MBI3276226.1 fumarylacetoacetate hydrolase family protein [Chlamydiota bacterium]
MRLVRYKSNEGHPEYGCVEGSDVYRVSGDPLVKVERKEKVGTLDLVSLLAPCRPNKILAIAINFPGIDGYSSMMNEPLVFLKSSTSVCGPGEAVINPFPALPWWGEAELAVVIKKPLKNILENQVREGILGFTIGNDVTVENVDHRDHHLARSKCPDQFCPIGPWIDTDFDPSDCLIEAIQNGEVIRRARSSAQVWQWPKIVSWLSTWITLEPWDVILTGNPPDTVGMHFVQHGDIYTARVEGLGELTNQFFVKGRSGMEDSLEGQYVVGPSRRKDSR